jgi:hypothetical protein
MPESCAFPRLYDGFATIHSRGFCSRGFLCTLRKQTLRSNAQAAYLDLQRTGEINKRTGQLVELAQCSAQQMASSVPRLSD